ncbi:hypothetical protein IGI04_036034 [Brassica rapa subsp. trilocularis]|uniref:Uncharacterized protein n=1 Tax=Brassica rapa subsp. trilocularis TaxID=1813537 RepID=A0ABQ7LDC7_BRACM|nr:hypothetical protein IGI04_036034 [Brassica rapa subsp. trilocularis]
MCVSVSTHRTSVGVRQHTHDVHVCPSAHTGRLWLSMCVRVCLSAHTRRPWLSISTHISTFVLGLSTLALPVDCLGDLGPRGLSVQYTKDVRGCPPAHTGRPWVFVAISQNTQDVRGCPSVRISARWSLDSARWPFPWTVRVILAHVGCLFSTHRTSVGVHQHTQYVLGCPSHTHDVCVCPSVHISARCSLDSALWPFPWTVRVILAHVGCLVSTHGTSVAVRVFPSVSVNTHRTSVSIHLFTYQHKTQDVRGCPPAHTGRPWLSVAVRQHTRDVRSCPCVSMWVCGCPTAHMTFVAVSGCLSAHTGRPCVSVSTHRTSMCVRQHTQDVHVCPSAHTGCPSVHISAHWFLDSARWPFLWTLWVILAHVGCLFSTHRTSVGVRQHTQDIRGCPWLSVSTHRMSVAIRVCPCVSVVVRQHTEDVRGYQWLSVSTDRTSICVCQHTQDVRVCLRVSVSTHRTSVAVHHTLALPVDSLGDFGPRGLSVQYTHDVRWCPSAHTGRPCVFVSTHRTSVCVRQHTQDVGGSICVCLCPSAHTGRPWLSISTHISTLVLGFSTLTFPRGCPSVSYPTLVLQHAGPYVDCLGDFGPRGLSVQYTQDVRVCPPAHIGRPWLSVLSVSTHRTSLTVRCVCVSVSTHRTSVGVRHTHGRPCVSVSTHRTSVAVHVCSCVSVSTHKTSRGCPSVHISALLVLGLSTLALPVDCLGDFGPRGLSVQYTKDVCGCPPAHTGRPWVFVAISQHTQDVRGCPSVHISARWSLDSARLPFLWTVRVIFGPRGLSVQYTQDVCGCPSAHTIRPWLSIIHISARWSLDSALWPFPWTVRVILAHVGCLVSTHGTSVAVRVCPSVSVNTHRTSVSIHQFTYQHVGLWTPHDGPFSRTVWVIFRPRGLSVQKHRTSVGVRQHTQDVRGVRQHTRTSVAVRVCPCVGCPPAHMTFVAVCQHTQTSMCVCQHTQDVHVCPSAHTGRPCVSVSTHRTSISTHISTLALPVDCSGDFGPRGLYVQYKKDARGCTSAHTGRSWVSVSTHRTSLAVHVCPCVSVSTHRTSVAVHQYTYQHVGPWTQHAGPSRGLQDVRAVRVCPSAHTGRLTLTLPVDCLGDFSPHGLSVQYTQDVRGCPSAHTGHLGLSVCVRQHTQDIRGCPCVSVCVRQQTHDVRGCLSVHIHISTLVVGLITLTLPVDCSGDFGPRGLSGQYTQDVCGCPWLSVCVHLCPPAHTGRPCLSISTHISTLVLGLRTLALPVDCLGDFGPRGLSVPYTQDVRRCPPVTPPILERIVRTAMVRGNVPASLRTSRQAFHGRKRSSVPTKSAPLAGLLAHSAETAERQLISARRTVRALGRWSGSGPWAKSRRLGAWVGLMTDPKPNQKGRWDASGLEGTTLGRWCLFASKSCLFVSKMLIEKRRERERESTGQEIGQKRAGRGGFVSPARRTKGLEKDSKAVVQSDRVSGVTTDSSAKTIGQSKPAGHTYRPDSPYGQLGRTVGTSEWVRVAKGHELPRGTSVQRVLFPKGCEFQTVPLVQGLGRTKWTVRGFIVKRMDGNPVWSWALLSGMDPGFGSDQVRRSVSLWARLITVRSHLDLNKTVRRDYGRSGYGWMALAAKAKWDILQ